GASQVHLGWVLLAGVCHPTPRPVPMLPRWPWHRPIPIVLCLGGESGQRAFQRQIWDKHTASSPSFAPQTPLNEIPPDVRLCSLDDGGDRGYAPCLILRQV